MMLFNIFDKILLIISGLLTGIVIFYISTTYRTDIYTFENENFSDYHIAGLILARGGSKGIPFKNLAKFSNTTLLGNTIRIMTEFGKFHSIWISTDNYEIAKEARYFNANVHIREAYTASDNAPSILGVIEFALKHPEVHIIGLIQCTSPFLRKEYLDKSLKLLKDGYQSVFSVTRQYKLRWKITIDGTIWPDNFSPLLRPRRQDWDGEIVENGMFYFSYSKLIKRNGALQSGRISVVEVPENHSLEIDSQNDLIIANVLQEISVNDGLA